MDQLSMAPDRQPEYYRGFRRVFLSRFPYKVFYLLEGNAVVVFRVLHGRQDHVRWCSEAMRRKSSRLAPSTPAARSRVMRP